MIAILNEVFGHLIPGSPATGAFMCTLPFLHVLSRIEADRLRARGGF